MPPLAHLVREATSGDDFDLELAALGSDDPDEIAALLSGFLSARLAPVGAAIFYRRGTGIVAGVLLSDGREVVIKVHRWRASVGQLSAVQRVQEHLALGGFPAPRPLLAPESLRAGVATVEEMRRGEPGDGHHPTIRRAIAEGLCSFVVAARPLRGLTQLGQPALFQPDDTQWPEPHDLRFDFASSSLGAEWIDELARDARGRIQGFDLQPVVGHLDWCAGNLGFDGDRWAAVYDWDSLALSPEPVIVGAAAAQFCADWRRGAALPSPVEMRVFVREYEESRDRPFDPLERGLLDAANLLQCAYGARCQHSDVVLRAVPGVTTEGGWIRLLYERMASPLFE
ncbi:MAG: hypothetical protein ABSB54_12065 [Acidimicrobiales bacterium]